MGVILIKILAFDQSTVKTGYSVFNELGNLESHGVINLTKIKNLKARETEMFQKIRELVKEEAPNVFVIEGVALQSNPQVLIKLGQLQGEIMSLAWQNEIPVYTYLPSKWRKILSFQQGKGTKRADLKKQAKTFVKEKFSVDATEDEAESICIGYAFVQDINDEKKEKQHDKEE